MSTRRDMRPYAELLNLMNEADDGIEALLDLLSKSDARVPACSLYRLLKPLHEKLRAATSDLNDMKIC